MKCLFATLLLMCVALSSFAKEYRYSQYIKLYPELQPAFKILIPRFEVRDKSIKNCLILIEQLADENDPSKKGIEIFIPKEFQSEFSKVSDTPISYTLGPNISLLTLFGEFGPVPWTFFPVSSRSFAYIPRSAIIQDIRDNTEQDAAANP